MFWTSNAEFESRLHDTEAKLLEYAKLKHVKNSFDVEAFDTFIPRSSVLCLKPTRNEKDKTLKIHCIKATSNKARDGLRDTAPFPLVNLHGYMNAGAYFYRNLGGLCDHFPTVYAVDMLGWGFSSRVPFHQVKDSGSVESAEDFFVESLEAWRSENKIEKIVLSGHSFGGYIAVAYAERYPERIDQLILLSPIGVPDPPDPDSEDRRNMSLRFKMFLGVFRTLFECTTPGAFLRTLTEYRASTLVRSYVDRRLPEVSDAEESKTLADFLFLNASLRGSGEYFLRSLFTSSIFAKSPLMFRVPTLKVRTVNFVYGTQDWMDVSGGMDTGSLTYKVSQDKDGSSSMSTPHVNVFLVPNAGHLLTIENPESVNACIIGIVGGKTGYPRGGRPMLMDLDYSKEIDESWMNRVQETLEDRQKRSTAK